MKGRPPKPTALKLLEGNAGHRRIDQAHEPFPEKAIPPCPDFLDDLAKKEWFRVAKELYTLGLLTELDQSSLASYCSYYSEWAAAEVKLRKLTLQRDRARSEKKKNQLWGEICAVQGNRRHAMKEKKYYEDRLGLSAASRTRIKVPDMQLPLPLTTSTDDASESPLDRSMRLAR